ncbi:MAG: hypothetical protein R2771_14365 [Saprospiraceae bacterium]
MKIFLIIINFLNVSLFFAQPAEFVINSTNSSAVVLGQAQINGIICDPEDWIAVFDESGNCAGASSVIVFGGLAYIPTIYETILQTIFY